MGLFLMTAIIDADSLFFLCSKDDIHESINNIDSFIETICRKTDCDDYILCLSQTPYFRLRYGEDYKANRPPSSLKWLKTLKMYLKERYNTFSVEGLEADDLCGWLKYSVIPDSIVCSIDKDVLYTVEGRNFNYKTHEWVDSTFESSTYFHKLQLLIGDSTDNVAGFKKGFGPKTAEKFIEAHINDFEEAIVKLYQDEYGEEEGVNRLKKVGHLVTILTTDEQLEQEGFDVASIKENIRINKIESTETEW